LPQCLEAEDLALFDVLPREEVYRRMREGAFTFAESFEAPMRGFPGDLAALSAYLLRIVSGVEVAERYAAEGVTDDVRAWKVVARSGEWVKVPLVVEEREDGSFFVDAARDDTEIVAAKWASYPRWFQDGMRLKYPRLRDL
ncbi:MAG: hypothetical protein ACREID_06855, partial [Planctomycetota bacterium]